MKTANHLRVGIAGAAVAAVLVAVGMHHFATTSRGVVDRPFAQQVATQDPDAELRTADHQPAEQHEDLPVGVLGATSPDGIIALMANEVMLYARIDDPQELSLRWFEQTLQSDEWEGSASAVGTSAPLLPGQRSTRIPSPRRTA